jgi:beta-glucanase (GH16 family)
MVKVVSSIPLAAFVKAHTNMKGMIRANVFSPWIAANEREEGVVPAPTPTPPPAGTRVPLGIPGNFSLVKFDDFDGTTLDPIWQPNWLGGPGPINSSENCGYAASQVSVSGGYLRLAAIKQSITDKNGKVQPYTSGMVNSSGKLEVTSGVVEARLTLAAGSNGRPCNWPAFWQDGHNWPGDGESDTMEILGVDAAVHFHGKTGTSGFDVPGNFAGDHTFAEDRYPDHIDYWYDGVKVGTCNNDMVQSPRYIILNYAISTSIGGELVVPSVMLVDHVGVWNRI